MIYNWKKSNNKKVDNLGRQFEKLMRMTNQNKFSTKCRYIDAQIRLINYLGRQYHLQKLTNLKDKHLINYVEKLKNEGKSDKYIKTELSAIRFLHNQMNMTKNHLMDSRRFNQMVGLGSTKDGRADRAWNEKEIESFKTLASKMNCQDYADIVEASRSMGLRLDEAVTLKRKQCKSALEKGYIHLTNTKGGVHRNVYLDVRSKKILSKKLSSNRINYLFTPEKYSNTKSIHKYKKHIQKFIIDHREKFQDSDRSKSGHNIRGTDKSALTFHGLRHSYARDQYFKLISRNISPSQARQCVSESLGHGRGSVTYIYLSSLVAN